MKAASKSVSITDDDSVTSAQSSSVADAPPSSSNDTGMITVASSDEKPPKADETVRMVNADGNEADVSAADVKIHERSGWTRKDQEA